MVYATSRPHFLLFKALPKIHFTSIWTNGIKRLSLLMVTIFSCKYDQSHLIRAEQHNSAIEAVEHSKFITCERGFTIIPTRFANFSIEVTLSLFGISNRISYVFQTSMNWNTIFSSRLSRFWNRRSPRGDITTKTWSKSVRLTAE